MMHRLFTYLFLLSTTLTFLGVTGYVNNCEGSSRDFLIEDCHAAMDKIDGAALYTDQQQFSTRQCYMKYATNKSGPQPVSGEVIRDTAMWILADCKYHKGSWGTGNCEQCHVTINFRAMWCAGC